MTTHRTRAAHADAEHCSRPRTVRPPSTKAIRLVDRPDHRRSYSVERHLRSAPGARRLIHGNGVTVGHHTVQPLMRRAQLTGSPTRRRPGGTRTAEGVTTDLVKRNFHRAGPNQLWVTDITEHPIKGGDSLLCRARRVLPPSRRLGHRPRPTRRPSHQCPRDGHRLPRQTDPGSSQTPSSTAATAPSSPPGLSPNAPDVPACCPVSAPSATPC